MAELTDQTRRLLLQLLQRALESDGAGVTAQTAVHRPPSQWFGNNDRIDNGDDGGVGMLTTNTMDSRDCISTPRQNCVNRGHP